MYKKFRSWNNKQINQRFVCIAWSFLFCIQTTYGAQIDINKQESDTNPIEISVERLIKRILLAEIKLARFNLHYRLEANKEGRWKGMRYFLFQEANNSLTNSGLIVSVAERMSHIRGEEFRHLHRGALMHSNVLPAVGQVIGAGGSLLEFGINGYHHAVATKKGFAPKTARQYVSNCIHQIDQDLSELQTKIKLEENNSSNKIAQMHACEIKVLADIRDLLVSEFNGFHIGARRSFMFQQSFYLLDAAKNITGALGNLYGYKALRQLHPQFTQTAGILVTISGAFIIVNPILSRLLGRIEAAFDNHTLKKLGLNTNRTLTDLERDYYRLQDTCKTHDYAGEKPVFGLVNRLNLYESQRQRFDQELFLGAKELHTGNRIAIQNILSGLFVGSTKLANGITITTAGFDYSHDLKVSNAIIAAGNIPYMVGSGYAVLDNMRIQLFRELNTYRRGKKHQLPVQLINSQLTELDALEKSIDSL